MNDRRGNLTEYERQLERESAQRLHDALARAIARSNEEFSRRIQAQRIRHEVGYYDVNDENATPSPDDEEANHEA